MPLPFLLGGAAAIAGLAGIAGAASGAKKIDAVGQAIP